MLHITMGIMFQLCCTEKVRNYREIAGKTENTEKKKMELRVVGMEAKLRKLVAEYGALLIAFV